MHVPTGCDGRANVAASRAKSLSEFMCNWKVLSRLILLYKITTALPPVSPDESPQGLSAARDGVQPPPPSVVASIEIIGQ